MNHMTPPRRRFVKRMRAPSDEWRRKFISQCAQHFKESRQNTVQAFRSRRLADKQQLRKALHARLKETEGGRFSNGISADEEDKLLLELEALLKEEVHKEQVARMERTEEEEDEVEEEGFKEQLRQESLGVKESGAISVLCPVCRTHRLRFEGGIGVCACGIRFGTANGSVLTEEAVQQSLGCLVEGHGGSRCCGKPVFSVRPGMVAGTLYMTCSACHADLPVI